MATTYTLANMQDRVAACQILSGGRVDIGANQWWGNGDFSGAADNEINGGNQTTRATILTALGAPSTSWLWKATLADVNAFLLARGIVAA